MIINYAKIIQRYLIGVGVVSNSSGAAAWPSYVTQHPPKDNTVSVRETTSKIDGSRMRVGAVYVDEHHAVQIRIKGKTVDEGKQKGLEIQNALANFLNELVETDEGNCILHGFYRTMSVTPMGTEEQNARLNFVLNGTFTFTEI